MIDEVVTPLASAALTAGPAVKGGDNRPQPSAPVSEAEGGASAPDPSASPYSIEVTLPVFLHEELSQVARSEDCEISEIVLNALDQFLADHWVRSEV